MPVFGIPIPSAAATPGAVASTTTRVFDVPVPERRRSVRIETGMAPVVAWTMTGRDGAALDLSAYLTAGAAASLGGDEAAAALRVGSARGGRLAATFAATSPAPAAGTLEATLEATLPAGIYDAEFAVVAANGVVIAANTFLLVVDPGLFGAAADCGPPALAEVRLALRDSGPAESQLLDNVTFDDAEIAQATRMAVAYFNEAVPPILRRFSTEDFPARYHWCRAIAALLFSTLAEYYRKNQLQYQAGGVAVDDFAKAAPYEAAFDKYWGEYTTWVRQTKLRMAQDECWGSADSPYQYADGFGGAWRQY